MPTECFVAKSNRQKLFSRMNMAPNGTSAIVALRQDLMSFLPENPELGTIDEDLKQLLRSWFNPGFLTLQRIDWNTEASILEKIIQYEAVHSIKNWDDLKQRLVAERRCFAFFHPALEDEPLIFVEVALTKGIPYSIQMIFNDERKGPEEANTAVFYSINNCQSFSLWFHFSAFFKRIKLSISDKSIFRTFIDSFVIVVSQAVQFSHLCRFSFTNVSECMA